MEYIGLVSSEGGPLLLMDASIADSWHGSEGNDYDRACNLFDATPDLEGTEIDIGKGKGILWEMGGAGTAAIFKASESHCVVVRPWLSDPSDNNALRGLAEQPLSHPIEIGELTSSGGNMVILWAAEDGSCIEPMSVPESGRVVGKMAMEESCLSVKLTKVVFRC